MSEKEKKDSIPMRLAKGLWGNVKKFLSPSRAMAEIAAYLRGGLKDLQDVVTQPFPESKQQNDVMGMIGSPTPQMVNDGLKGKTGKVSTSGNQKETTEAEVKQPEPNQFEANQPDPKKHTMKEPSQAEIAAEMSRMQGKDQSLSQGR